MVADLSALYLIRVGDRSFVRRGTPAAVASTALHAVKAVTSSGPDDLRDLSEQRLRQALEDLFADLAPETAARLERGEMPSEAELTEAFAGVIQPQLVEAAVAAYTAGSLAVGVQFDPAHVNQKMRAWSETYTYDLVKGLNDTTRAGLQQAMSAFTTTPGMTRGDLEDLVRKAGFSEDRASAIATTEVTRAHSAAQSQYQQDLAEDGIETEKIWHTAADEVVCARCGPLNGRPESKWKDRYPSGPPAHTNCRCSCTLRHVESED